MKITEARDILIPAIAAFCKVPIIQADQTGDIPDGPHATYKFTTPYAKDVGQAETTFHSTDEGMELHHKENYKATLSITAYAMDSDISHDLAQQIHDWFGYQGHILLDNYGIVVVEKTNVVNRDAIFVEEYERRNGFDVIMRLSRKIIHDVDYFEYVDGITNR